MSTPTTTEVLCQTGPGPECVPAPVVVDAVFVCGGDQQVNQCTGPTQIANAPTLPVLAPSTMSTVILVPASSPVLPATGSADGLYFGLGGVMLVVGVLLTRVGRRVRPAR